MKNWRQWPWKRWGKMYLLYSVLWVVFDLLFLAIEERKSLADIFISAPFKALTFLVIFEFTRKPKAKPPTNNKIFAADSNYKSITGNGEAKIE